MIRLLVNGNLVVLKQGATIDYVSENRMFTSADSYTLNIEVPLCPQNIAIFGHLNRLDATLPTSWDAQLIIDSVCKVGSVALTEVENDSIKVQFLEGRSAQNYAINFDEVYINELALDAPAFYKSNPLRTYQLSYDDGLDYVLLPWCNKESGIIHNPAELWEGEDEYINSTAQPFLLYITKAICGELEYTADFSEWEESPWRHLIICNILPPSWGKDSFSQALPHWSVTKFFEQLEILLNGEIDINHATRHIQFRFCGGVISSLSTVKIDNIVDESSVSVSSDTEESSTYREARSICYGDNGYSRSYLNSCDWYVDQFRSTALNFANMENLCAYAANWQTATFNKLMYAQAEDVYCIMSLDYTDGDNNYYKVVPINRFAPSNRGASDSVELGFLPVPIEIMGQETFCMVLEPGAEEVESTIDSESLSTIPEQLLANGEQTESEIYSNIFIGIWPGYEYLNDLGFYPVYYHAFTDNHYINNFYYCLLDFPSLSLRDRFDSPIYRVDESVKYNITFIHNGVLDARSIYYFHGHKYMCVRLQTTISDDYPTTVYKGEFYRIVD